MSKCVYIFFWATQYAQRLLHFKDYGLLEQCYAAELNIKNPQGT